MPDGADVNDFDCRWFAGSFLFDFGFFRSGADCGVEVFESFVCALPVVAADVNADAGPDVGVDPSNANCFHDFSNHFIAESELDRTFSHSSADLELMFSIACPVVDSQSAEPPSTTLLMLCINFFLSPMNSRSMSRKSCNCRRMFFRMSRACRSPTPSW